MVSAQVNSGQSVFTMISNRPVPGRTLVLKFIHILRFVTALYVAALSVTAVVISGLTVHVGGIIASIYLIPASFALLALEFGWLRSRVGALKHRMQPLRTIGLQFISAMLTGVSWPFIEFFIPCCVAFGLSLGLTNLVGIYYLFWGQQSGEDGLDAWSECGEKSLDSESRIVFDVRDGEQDVLLIRNGSDVDMESARTSQSSLCNGPKIISVD